MLAQSQTTGDTVDVPTAQRLTNLTDAQLAVVAANANGGAAFTNTIPTDPRSSPSGANVTTVIVTVNSDGYVSEYGYYDSQTGLSDPNKGGGQYECGAGCRTDIGSVAE